LRIADHWDELANEIRRIEAMRSCVTGRAQMRPGGSDLPLDMTMTVRLLSEAELGIAERQRCIERQREVIAELERDGHDATQPKTLLKTFEVSQGLRVAERDRLSETLKNARHVHLSSE
jgi:hypothetical protein